MAVLSYKPRWQCSAFKLKKRDISLSLIQILKCTLNDQPIRVHVLKPSSPVCPGWDSGTCSVASSLLSFLSFWTHDVSDLFCHELPKANGDIWCWVGNSRNMSSINLFSLKLLQLLWGLRWHMLLPLSKVMILFPFVITL